MWGEITKHLSAFGAPAFIIGITVAILAWRAPQIYREYLNYRHKEKAARRQHELTMERLRLDSDRKNDKVK